MSHVDCACDIPRMRTSVGMAAHKAPLLSVSRTCERLKSARRVYLWREETCG